MTSEEIDKLITNGEFPEATKTLELIETHISWVILCDNFVYKIKKPITYSFLDFSTLEKRKYYYNRELQLNQRFAKDIYLEVLPIYCNNTHYKIGNDEGKPIEYVLKMRRLNPTKRMDKLLQQDRVSEKNIIELAEWIANFHKNAPVINNKDIHSLKREFKPLVNEQKYISEQLGSKFGKLIDWAITFSNHFLEKNEMLLYDRLRNGFFRDGHGDLHSRNIFLLPKPQPFDCIEFNDNYRQIDVLNEVAFLCMDLDAFGKKMLSNKCYEFYNTHFPTVRTETENQLFIFYKAYRANVRAKINSLRAKSTRNSKIKDKALTETKKYLLLMKEYFEELSKISG